MCKTCTDSDGNLWYEVELPFDDKGALHYLSLRFGVNRTAQEKGWVKKSDTVLTSPLNWPSFKLAKETGKGSKDARIDYKNLTPFFKELFEGIDITSSGALSAGDVNTALKDNVMSDSLSRVIAKHPSEWQADANHTKWQHLKEIVPDEAALKETKKQIKSLAWWGDAKAAGADLPVSPEIYHLHGLSCIENLKYISSMIRVRRPRPSNVVKFINLVLSDARLVKLKYNIPISVLIAQAALESGWGRYVKDNAYFGIKAHNTKESTTSFTTTEYVDGKKITIKDSFRSYKDFGESAEDYGLFLNENKRYKPAFKYTSNPLEFTHQLQKSGYATDPKYSEKLNSIIINYYLDDYDNE